MNHTMTPIPGCHYCRETGHSVAASFQIAERRSPKSGIGENWTANVDACLGCARNKLAAGAIVTVHPAAKRFRTLDELKGIPQ